ncbi:MAG: hypothetical protein ACKO5L_08180 [Bacteroidota bacterium]|jgi:hypothetical protein
MADFKSNRKELDEELEKFMRLLEELLPHYHQLLKKTELSRDELTRLGEIEHYLIGVNAKILEIKKRLEQDLFGQSLHTYYKTKQDALSGDPQAKLKLERMRDAFAEALKTGEIMSFN